MVINELGLSEHDVKSTAMGQSGPDIYLSSTARERFPFAVECKRQETCNIWEWLRQTEANAKLVGLHPLLAFRRNNGETYIVLRKEDFVTLVKGERIK